MRTRQNAGLRAASHFAADQRGGIMALFAVSTGLLFGCMALVWDIGRTVSVATELQSFADHLALAAAAELDGEDGAIAAASAVIASGDFDDRQTFATGGATLDQSDVTFAFYSDLPNDDTDPLTGITTDDLDARYVEVVVRPHTVTNLFTGVVAALGGPAIADGVVTANAVAGHRRIACATTPITFCTPDGSGYRPEPGRMLHLKMNGLWQPGAFGLLANNFEPDSACGNSGTAGGAVVGCITGISDNVTRCYDPTGVTIVNTVSAREVAGGLNSRFDIYLSTLSGRRNDSRFAPAPNVIKAIQSEDGDSCISDLDDVTDLGELPAATRSVPLPRDACFDANGICSVTGTRLGTGVTTAELDDYWATNHGTPRPSAATRYELYQEEIATAPAIDRILKKATSEETGAPICYRDGTDPTPEGPERRLVSAAVINCDPGQGLPIRGLVDGVPVLSFVQLFLTEPAELSPGGSVVSIWAEEVQVLRPGSDGLGSGRVHDVTQLFR